MKRFVEGADRGQSTLFPECLNETLFTSLAEVRAVLAEWCDDYNQIRPHSSLNNQTPIEFARQWGGSPERYGGSTHRPIAQPTHMAKTRMGSTFEWKEEGAQVMRHLVGIEADEGFKH